MYNTFYRMDTNSKRTLFMNSKATMTVLLKKAYEGDTFYTHEYVANRFGEQQLLAYIDSVIEDYKLGSFTERGRNLRLTAAYNALEFTYM